MKYLLIAVVALALLNVALATETTAQCHPECRWQCDDPVCPAQCHPVCERPKCQVHCEETECAKCKVHCDKPKCNVRCPKDLCEKDTCPKCETVCSPANCRTSCVAPEPKCTPMCEETKCDWKCKKPTLCPRPKCELVCDKPKCEAQEPVPVNPQIACCACSTTINVVHSINQANAAVNMTAVAPSLPTLLEVMANIKHAEKEGASSCCACAPRT